MICYIICNVLCLGTLTPIEEEEANLAAWIDVHPEDEPRAHHYQDRRHINLKGSVTLSERERESEHESECLSLSLLNVNIELDSL